MNCSKNYGVRTLIVFIITFCVLTILLSGGIDIGYLVKLMFWIAIAVIVIAHLIVSIFD